MQQVTFRCFDYQKDLVPLYTYMMDEESQCLFSHGFQIHNLPMFEAWVSEKFAKNEFHDFFMIENPQGMTIGFTYSYEFFNYDAHCKFTLCLFEEYQDLGYGAIVAAKMMDYLFTKYPLRRIFVSVFGYNEKSLSNNLKGGFEEVAVLPEYRYKGGEYFPLHILSMARKDFYQRHGRILSKITNH